VQKEKFQYIKMILDTLVTTYLPVFLVNKLEYLQKEKQKTLRNLQNKKQTEPKTQSGLERKKKDIEKYQSNLKKIQSSYIKYSTTDQLDSIISEMLEEIHQKIESVLNFIQREKEKKTKLEILLKTDQEYKQYLSKNRLLNSYQSQVKKSTEIPEWISNNLSPEDFKLFLDAIQDEDIDGLNQLSKIAPPTDPKQFLMYLKVIKPFYYSQLMAQKASKPLISDKQLKEFYQKMKQQESKY
jgi:chromosome segregation ATPase